MRAKLSAAKMGKPSPKKGTGVIIDKTCRQCGMAFQIPGKRIGKSSCDFCGLPCWYAFLRQQPENHPGYKGGYEPYYGPDWNEQARQARDRDQHTCQDCGKQQRTPRLDVHHIQPKRLFHGDYVAANQLVNLITLCKSCHSRRPKN
jgi:hypothetical protein